MGYALLFSGQGAQHRHMLSWVRRDRHVEQVENLLGADWRDRLDDPVWSGNNRHAQVLITGLAMAAFEQLVAEAGPPAVVAGYSVGELAAFCAAGVLDPDTVLALAVQRAACMDAAHAHLDTGLMGVSSARLGGLRDLCEAFDLDLAIRLGPESGVVGGPNGALVEAAAFAEVQGMRVTRLNVALASHTRWMQQASVDFRSVLATHSLSNPRIPVISNAMGQIRDAAQALDALASQLSATVRWDECLDHIESRRVDAVLELGPGQALARMWSERFPDVPARSVDEFRSLPALVDWLTARLP
jgi:[acyl-carrier-protein] S-malonyltransferase